MQSRFSISLIAVLLLVLMSRPSFANDKIQAFVSTNGRVVFTNLVDNAPGPAAPVIPETSDVLADEVPVHLRAVLDTIALNHGVDPGLVRAVMKVESNFNRFAVSPKGAQGLMQLIPATARRFGVQDSFDVQQNIEGGVRYLRFLLDKFNGNLDLSLAAYNAGENLVQRLGRVPPIRETTNYVRKIRAIYKKPSAPVVQPPAMIAAAMPAEAVKDDPPGIFRSVDRYGVVRFSNIGPPN